MDAANLILTENVSMPKQLGKIKNNASQKEKEQFAKEFEDLLINKLLDEMKKTIGDWGGEKDGPSKQIYGMFWSFLATDIANNGGMGLWKDIQQSLTNLEHKSEESLDTNI